MTAAATPIIAMQPASIDIWESKYQLRSKAGEVVDLSIEHTYRRVAKALAACEHEDIRAEIEQQFLWALRNGAIPAGRIISNAGAQEYKPATSTINCTVSGTINDSMDDILFKNYEAGLTLKAGCGIGYEFSTLRPRNAYVAGAGAKTSGPLSFMDIYDKMCVTVSSAGGRRGAQMATFDVHHPDVMAFIQAKREDGRLRQFNCSLLITNDFMNAVRDDADWILSFPVTASEVEKDGLDLTDRTQFVYREFPVTEGYVTDADGNVACRIYDAIPARTIYNTVMESTYNFAEPGFLLIDKANEMNNAWWCEFFRATNPCGEQFLPPYGSCLLGSVNLVACIIKPFTSEARFDFAKLGKVVKIFTRMLDNVCESHGLALPKQAEELRRKRRHGMGYLGLGSAMTMLCMTYGSAESVAFTDEISKQLAVESWKAGLELALEKGAAPIMDEDFEITPRMMAQRPAMAADGYKVGDTIKGRILHARYSKYMQQIASVEPELVKALEVTGARFTHATSIAPTGTIALSLANNASNGIEPSFSHSYSRNIIRENKKTKEKVEVCSYELLAYRTLVNPKADPFAAKGSENALPDYFISADSVTPHQHVDVQAAAQVWIDSSISKTINVATECDFESFKEIYTYAFNKGLKGCTTFRFNPEAFQGVLVNEKDLANTFYEFTLADGSKVKVAGNEEIEYDGETHTAANLYDALKEGTYGK